MLQPTGPPTPILMDRNCKHFMLHNRRNGNVPVARDRHRRSIGSVDRKAPHTIDHNWLDVCDMRYS